MAWPGLSSTARRIGTFLMLTAFHATYTASGIFLTGMVANPLIAEFARKAGHVELTWMVWFEGSSLPGLPFPGNPERYPTRDEVVSYLKRYALRFDLPVSAGVRVQEVERSESIFLLRAANGRE